MSLLTTGAAAVIPAIVGGRLRSGRDEVRS